VNERAELDREAVEDAVERRSGAFPIETRLPDLLAADDRVTVRLREG
jgi:hypothetical protein